jgi:hypothetical protein
MRERDLFGRPRLRCEDNIKMALQIAGCGGMELNRAGSRIRKFVDAVMNLRVP